MNRLITEIASVDFPVDFPESPSPQLSPQLSEIELLWAAIRAQGERIVALERSSSEKDCIIVELRNSLKHTTLSYMDALITAPDTKTNTHAFPIVRFADSIAFHCEYLPDLTPFLGLSVRTFMHQIHTTILSPISQTVGRHIFEKQVDNSRIQRLYDFLRFGITHQGQEFIASNLCSFDTSGRDWGFEGLEIRRLTGPYQYVEGAHYKHRFPTEFVRLCTKEETLRVMDGKRANPDGFQWGVRMW